MTSNNRGRNSIFFVGILVIELFAGWLRWPGVGEGLPYLYREDEAHHFNRVVRMVQEHRLNPEYFHKPSLHFYLRMPVVYAGYLYSKSRHQIDNLKQISTRDPYGIGGYAFWTSHPSIAKFCRSLSVVLSLLIVLFTALLARTLKFSNTAALAAAAIAAASPALVADSAIIGVDTLMALMCLVAVYMAVRLFEKFSMARLVCCGLFCGFAVSSKYNALPVCVLPLMVCALQARLSSKEVLTALLAPVAGFFAGSPFILVETAMFVEHLRYEIWHYAVAGHEGHTEARGIPQAVFYLKWLLSDALGWAVVMAALVGIWGIFLRKFHLALIVFIFPLLFFLLMIFQKVNFTRNMLAVLPFIALGAAYLIELARVKVRASGILVTGLVVLLLGQPLAQAMRERSARTVSNESRKELKEWLLSSTAGPPLESAISGSLQVDKSTYSLPGVSRVNLSLTSPLDLYLSGFDRLISGPTSAWSSAVPPYLQLEHLFQGGKSEARIVQNPEISVYSFLDGSDLSSAVETYLAERPYPAIVFDSEAVPCHRAGESPPQSGENYCWLQRRIEAVKIATEMLPAVNHPADTFYLRFKVMSPWAGQSIALKASNWSAPTAVNSNAEDAGKWHEITFNTPAAALRNGQIYFKITQLHSPLILGISSDPRRLGAAIKELEILR